MPSDKDREEATHRLARIIVAKIAGSLEANPTYIAAVETLLCAHDYRIRAEAKAECEQFYAITSARALDELKRELREKYAMEFRKNKIEWETSVKSEALKEAGDRFAIKAEFLGIKKVHAVLLLNAILSTDSWDSACGEKWSFTADGPRENGVNYCRGCGKPVRIADEPNKED